MKAVTYLLKKMRRYDPNMLLILLLFTLLSAAYPFIWVVVPSRILALYEAGDSRGLWPLLLMGGGLALVCAFAIAFLRGNYRMRMNKVRYHLIRDLARHSLCMPYENTLHERALNDIKLANDSVGNPQEGAGGIILTLLKVLGEALAALGFLGLLSRLPWWLLAAVVALVGTSFLLSQHRTALEDQQWQQTSPQYRKRDTAAGYVLDPAARKDNILYGLGGLLQTYIRQYHTSMLAIARAFAGKRMRVDALMALLNLLRDGLLYGFLVYQFVRGHLTLANFYLYMSGVLGFVAVAQSVMDSVAHIRYYATQFAHFMKLDMQPGQQPEPLPAPQEAKTLNMQGLCFRYPGGERNVVDNLDLTIHPGEKIALVGENGCGKSTLIHLLCRLYRPQAGTITWGNEDIFSMSEAAWRSMLSVVFQDAMLLPFSMADNIAMEEPADAGRVDRAVQQSGLQAVVDQQPKGLRTSLLRVLDDDGVDLSGGERQRLFLARALYKPGTRMLILDEPTAALDPLNERALYQAYAAFCEGKSSIFVSHRLASTAFCDRIVLMHGGRVAEEGTHQDLLRLGGRYAHMFNIQAKNYRDTAEATA